MTRWRRILGVVVAGVGISASTGLAVFFWRYPRVAPAPAVRVDRSVERVERGQYLATHVTVCIDCHSTRNWEHFSGPLVPGTEGRGGERFGEDFGFPGTFYAANITPAGIGAWTDGEILRAITGGVTQTGRAMFPVMPYPSYRALTEADAEAIVAYLRTLRPVAGAYPAARLNFPVNLLVRTIPQPYEPHLSADHRGTIAHGEYLTTIAACADCHTPKRNGDPMLGMVYAGGAEFPMPRGGLVRSANITPDVETGIGAWSREVFVARFQNFSPDHSPPVAVGAGEFNTIMPWTMYAGMTDEDLGAIYEYLRTVKPVRNTVTTFSGSR